MSNTIRLKKGLNIPLAGAAELLTKKTLAPELVAIKPSDFRGLKARLAVKEGDRVLSGSPILLDKERENVCVCSPVSGTVSEVVRGDKRKLLAVLIKADKATEWVDFGATADIDSLDAAAVKSLLLKSGLWACILERPYGVIANPAIDPKAIFVSAFSSSPLAADTEFTLGKELGNIQAAVDALGKIAPVHIGTKCAKSVFNSIENADIHIFEGKHPAGNVGIQIHAISPIRKGQTVWTLTLDELAAIGRLLKTGHYDLRRKFAICGPAALYPCYIETVPGFGMSDIHEFYGTTASETRFVSGDCLSGENIGLNGFTGFHSNMVTLLKEGDHYEAFGWANPIRSKLFSSSHTYFHWLFGWLCPKKYELDTNLHGGERAFVVSDVYGKVLPMKLFPVYLVKACMAGDIDKMERYGIYEVLPEDLALCEYVDPSKINIQQYISDGIDLMLKEMA